jgi:hypothetical protein
MKTFNDIWLLLSPKAEYANRKRACYDLWCQLSAEQQDVLYETISEKLSKGKFVDYNPLFALKNNSQHRRLVLSFDAYYDIYHTTEERDGWKMVKPEKAGDPPVHYVKIV